MPPSESAKLRALRAKNVLMFQRVLRAYIPTCLACLRAHVSTCLACWCANVLCVFTCQRVFRAYVQSALRVLVLTWNVPCVLTCSRAHVPCVPCPLTGKVPCVLTYRKYQQ